MEKDIVVGDLCIPTRLLSGLVHPMTGLFTTDVAHFAVDFSSRGMPHLGLTWETVIGIVHDAVFYSRVGVLKTVILVVDEKFPVKFFADAVDGEYQDDDGKGKRCTDLTRKELYKRLKKSDLETKLYNSRGVVF